MKLATTVIAVAALLTSTVIVSAAGKSHSTPGHQMQVKGSVKGTTGASGYAPGHRMQASGSVKGTTGASGYAPGHATTGAGVNSNVGVRAGGAGVNSNVGISGSVR